MCFSTYHVLYTLYCEPYHVLYHILYTIYYIPYAIYSIPYTIDHIRSSCLYALWGSLRSTQVQQELQGPGWAVYCTLMPGIRSRIYLHLYPYLYLHPNLTLYIYLYVHKQKSIDVMILWLRPSASAVVFIQHSLTDTTTQPLKKEVAPDLAIWQILQVPS